MDLKESQSVRTWLSGLTPVVARNYLSNFSLFYRWLNEKDGPFKGKSPDELIEYQKNADNKNHYKILDEIIDWIRSMGELRRATKKTRYASIRSFFMHNRAELPRDPSFRIRATIPKTTGKLNVEHIKKVVNASNKVYRAILLSFFQGAMDTTIFEYWNENGWPALKESLRSDPDVIKIDLPGRKHQRNITNYYTFIGRDAIKAIKTYLPLRPEGGSYIFYNKDGKPITKANLQLYWMRQLLTLGLIDKQHKGRKNRYGMNLHEMRDVFRSQWTKSGVDKDVAEFCMGHQVDPLFYDKAYRDVTWVQRQYENAMERLQIESSNVPFGLINEQDQHKLLERVQRKYEELRSTDIGRIAQDLEALRKENQVLKMLFTRALQGDLQLSTQEDLFKIDPNDRATSKEMARWYNVIKQGKEFEKLRDEIGPINFEKVLKALDGQQVSG